MGRKAEAIILTTEEREYLDRCSVLLCLKKFKEGGVERELSSDRGTYQPGSGQGKTK